MRMIVRHHQNAQIHHIDNPHLDAGNILLQKPRCGTGLNGRNVACASEYDIWFFAPVVGRKLPDRCASRAMFEGLVHVQPLKLRLLAAGNDVDVVAAPQAVVENAQQAIAVRRVIDADGFTPARQSIVYKSGCLMAETL